MVSIYRCVPIDNKNLTSVLMNYLLRSDLACTLRRYDINSPSTMVVYYIELKDVL